MCCGGKRGFMATDDGSRVPAGSFESVFERSPNAILVLDDRSGSILDANEAATELFGASREQLCERTLGDLHPEAGTEIVRRATEAGTIETEWQIEAAEGVTSRVDVTISGTDGDGNQVLAFFDNRSDRRRTEQELAERDHLKTVVENLPVVLFALDPDGTFTLSRGRALSKLGLEPGEAVGLSIDEMYADYPEILAAAERALDGEDVEMTAGLAGLSFKTWYRPITDDDGAVTQVLGVSMDVTEQKAIEQRLRTVIDAVPAAVFMSNDDGKIEYANDMVGELLAADGSPVGKQTSDVVGGEMADEFADIRREAIESGEPVEAEYTLSAGSGQRHVKVTVAPADEQMVVGVVMDLTEREERERRLQKNDAILTQLTETTDDVFWLFDADFTEIQFVNDAYEEVWGRSVADLEEDAMDFLEGVHPEDREMVVGAVEQLRNGEPSNREYRVNPEEDFERWVWVRGDPILDEGGEVERVAGFARDITERKEREQRLEESNRQFQAVFNDPHALVGLLDTDGRLRRVNETALESVGLDRESVLGMPFPETPWWSYDAELQADVRRWIDRAAGGEYVGFEAEHPLPDGDLMAVEGTLRPVTDDDGTVTSLIVSARDITERKERKRQLEKSNERLEQFAYVASHDLQEPLRTISNYIEMIAEDYGDALDEEAEELVDVVVTGSERMQSMINGLLDYSRVTTRGDTFEPVDTDQVLEDVAEDLEIMLEDHDGQLDWSGLPTVEGDGDQLRQVFQNLVKNALEHAEGPVSIDVRAEDVGDSYRFSVADDGPGIEPSRQEKIFRIFKSGRQYQTSSQAKGIGLAICDNIVDRHGGDIWVESEPGEGATFVFTIDKEQSED